MALLWTSIEAACLVFVFIGALFGNVILFYIVAKLRALQTKANVFILNLAAADLLVAVFNVPVTCVAVIAEDWILGKTVCLMTGFITLLTFVASCMALSMISIIAIMQSFIGIRMKTSTREENVRFTCV